MRTSTERRPDPDGRDAPARTSAQAMWWSHWSWWCGVAVALPLLGVVVGLWRAGWAPQGDNALLSWRAWLVVSGHPPLLGPYTQASGDVGAVYDPGPLHFVAMAVPTRVWPELGPAVATVLLGMASVVAGVVAVGRTAGRAAALLVAAGGLVASITAAQALADPVWNPFACLLPFAGLLLLAWAIAAGELAWWPVAVLLASYCAQTHLTYAVPSVAVVLVAPVLGWRAAQDADPGRRQGWRWVVIGVGVGAAAWIAPLWQQVTGEPGNLSMLWRTAGGDGESVSAGKALQMLASGVVGPPPAWLVGPTRDPIERIDGVRSASPWIGITVLVLLVVASVVARRRQDRVTLGVNGVALAACTGFVVGMRGASLGHVALTLWYMLTVLYPVAMVAWLALGWSLWRLVIQPRLAAVDGWQRGLDRHGGPGRVALGAGVALVLASITVTVWISHWGPHSWDGQPTGWRYTRAVSREVLDLVDEADLPRGRVAVAIDNLGPGSQSVRRGVGYGLLTRGWTPALPDSDVKLLDDDRYRIAADDSRLVLVDDAHPAPSSSRLLGQVHDPMGRRDLRLYLVA